MVACNPRDKEAAHRAEVEGIATENEKEVTCKKCLKVIKQIGEQFARLSGKGIRQNNKDI